MRVPDGVTVYQGGRKFVAGEELPNDLLPTVKTEPVAIAKKPGSKNEPA